MEVYYFNANLLAKAFVFSDIIERLKTAFYILCLEALCLFEMPKLSAKKTDFRCTNFVHLTLRP